MNYKVIKDTVSGKHQVFETATEQVIESFERFCDAKSFMKRLNLGGGFDGWTPSFFARKIEVKGI